MYIPYFTSVQTLIDNQLSSVKTIDYFNEQYTRYTDLKAVAFPAVYVQFGQLEWQDAGKGLQVSEADIRLHVVHFDVGDSPRLCLQLASDLNGVLNGRSLNYADQKISTGLSLTSSELVTEYDQIKVMILTYHTLLMDCSALPQYTKRKVALHVEKIELSDVL